MQFFELITNIRAYCTANSIKFVYGMRELRDVHLQNIVVSDNLGANELVLFAGFNTQPKYASGTVVACNYSGFFMLGKHCEASTTASLDETQAEKYDRRLKYLTSKLATIIGEISCSNDLIITNSISIQELINQFDENLDCVETEIVYSH